MFAYIERVTVGGFPNRQRFVRRLLATAAVVLLVVVGSAAATGGRASAASGEVHRFLWGAWIGRQFTGHEAPWSWKAVREFETRNVGGKHLRVIHWSVEVPWKHEFRYWKRTFNKVHNRGAFSMVDMGTGGTSARAIAHGAHDRAFRVWAHAAKRWRHPIFLRFDSEMNGGWYGWGTTAPARNTPAQFVAAWRHVHRIFTNVGATNVRWVWCPNIDPYKFFTKVSKLYPGNRYVDWTCLDGYNRGNPWVSFSYLYGSTYRQIMRFAASKPMIVGEVASVGSGPRKARWIKNMFSALRTRFPDVQGLLWQDKYGLHPGHSYSYPLETSRAASTAFRRGINQMLAWTCRGLTGSSRARCFKRGMS